MLSGYARSSSRSRPDSSARFPDFQEADKGGSMDPNKLYVANVPADTTEAALRSHFSACGGVLQVDLPDEHQRGKMRGLACVTMTSPAFASAARAQLDGVSFAGRVL